MKDSSDFRYIAREALAGKWSTAVLVGLIASIISSAGSIGANFDTKLSVGFSAFVCIASILSFCLTSIITVGYSNFNLKLTDGKYASIEDLFAYFSHSQTVILTALVKTVIIVLLSLLFIVPGIIASYSYALTDYILAENPELSISEVLSRSKQMMQGNRLRLFCLRFSFLGWAFLCVLTLGIGTLWLTPYQNAATAAFYRELTGDNVLDGSEQNV